MPETSLEVLIAKMGKDIEFIKEKIGKIEKGCASKWVETFAKTGITVVMLAVLTALIGLVVK